jgi:pimeloyl-ACP methyl ester carboxylesterase
VSGEPVVFVNDRGQRLAGVLHGRLGETAVVSCHGMLSTKSGRKHVLVSEELSRRGIPVLRFDFAGRGESEGSLFELSYSSQMADLAAALDYLASRGVRRFGLFGSSLGGAVALLAAARDERVIAIATLAAIGHAAAAIERREDVLTAFETRGYIETSEGRIGRGLLEDARSHDILAAVRVLRATLLVIHGEDDDVVPVSDAHDIATSARNASLELIAGAGHSFDEPQRLRPVIRHVTDFFADTLGSATPP